MTEHRYRELQDVVMDASFPELDLALRRGRHVDRDDFAWYTLLVEAQDHLETFYRRYGCELVHKPDGYFYLLPSGDKLSRRQLGAGDMLVGQALALQYLDPSTIERGGRVTQEDVIAQLVVVLGADALVRAFNPKRRRQDERIAQKIVRARIGEAVRHLAALGFVDLLDDAALKLRPALLRFADPVRGLSEPAEALAKLVAQGEVALVSPEDADASAEDGDPDDDVVARDDEDLEEVAAAEAASERAESAEPQPGTGDAAGADMTGSGRVRVAALVDSQRALSAGEDADDEGADEGP